VRVNRWLFQDNGEWKKRIFDTLHIGDSKLSKIIIILKQVTWKIRIQRKRAECEK